MTVKDFIILILAGFILWMFFSEPTPPDTQRAVQSVPTAVYHIDTSQPTTIRIVTPQGLVQPAPAPTATGTAVPTASLTSESTSTPEAQRSNDEPRRVMGGG